MLPFSKKKKTSDNEVRKDENEICNIKRYRVYDNEKAAVCSTYNGTGQIVSTYNGYNRGTIGSTYESCDACNGTGKEL